MNYTRSILHLIATEIIVNPNELHTKKEFHNKIQTKTKQKSPVHYPTEIIMIIYKLYIWRTQRKNDLFLLLFLHNKGNKWILLRSHIVWSNDCNHHQTNKTSPILIRLDECRMERSLKLERNHIVLTLIIFINNSLDCWEWFK